jgi:nucleotide-binding universal stress UspA family protein
VGAKLTVIHVVPHLERIPGEYFERDWEVEVKQLVTADLEKLFTGKPGDPTLMVEGGDPVDAICGAARDKAADLMVIGRGTASGIFGRMRAHAYEIIRESPCPVVSV